MEKKIVRNSKMTIGKTKKTAPVILKAVSGKATRPAGADRLQVRERSTVLAIAKILAEKA